MPDCEICGEPATPSRTSITPPADPRKSRTGLVNGKPVLAWLCTEHVRRTNGQRGWQEREEARRAAEERRLAEAMVANQRELF